MQMEVSKVKPYPWIQKVVLPVYGLRDQPARTLSADCLFAQNFLVITYVILLIPRNPTQL